MNVGGVNCHVHCKQRWTKEQRIRLSVLTIVEDIILPKYLKQSHQIFLKKKIAWKITRILRKTMIWWKNTQTHE